MDTTNQQLRSVSVPLPLNQIAESVDLNQPHDRSGIIQNCVSPNVPPTKQDNDGLPTGSSISFVQSPIMENKICTRESALPSVDTAPALKIKVAELFADLESLRYEHMQSLERQSILEDEVLSLTRSRDHYYEELKATQQLLSDSGRDNHVEFSNVLREVECSNHRLIHEKASLQIKLAQSHSALINAKRNMSRQLELIQSDMVERESLFQRLAAERNYLQQNNTSNSERIQELQDRLLGIQRDYELLQKSLSTKEVENTHLSGLLFDAESRCKAFVIELEASKASSQEVITELKQKLEASYVYESQNTELVLTIAQKDEMLSRVIEEKTGLEAALKAANHEKDVLDTRMVELKHDLSEVGDRLEALKYELSVKGIRLDDLELAQENLKLEKVQLQTSLSESSNTITTLTQQREDLRSQLSELRWTCDQLQENISSLHSAVNQASYSIESVKQSSDQLSMPSGHAFHVNSADSIKPPDREAAPRIEGYFSPISCPEDDFCQLSTDSGLDASGYISPETITPCVVSPVNQLPVRDSYQQSSRSLPVPITGGNATGTPNALSEAILKVSREATEALSSLAQVRKMLERESARAEKEAEARKQEVESHLVTKVELDSMRAELTRRTKEAEDAKNELILLQGHQTARVLATNDELEALKNLIKTTTEHLAFTTRALDETTRDKVRYQNEVADLKGGIRAHLERYSTGYPTHNGLPVDSSINGSTNLFDSFASVGMTMDELKGILGPMELLPLAESKPLSSINKCFEALQQEISALEADIVDHTSAVCAAIPSTV